MRINLITSDGKSWYKDRVIPYPDIELFENCYEDYEWDVVAVFENTVISRSCFKTKHLVLLSGEPPFALVYPSGYLKQFEKVVTCNKLIKHPNVILEQPAEPIHIGRSWKSGDFTMNYSELENLSKPGELKPISLVSSKLCRLPGHRRRLELVNWIIKQGYPIDIFGRGRRFVDDKIDSLLPYMFHICIENDAIKGYWTEKIADTIVCNTVPIYYGCPDIGDYFDKRCMFTFSSKEELSIILSRIMEDPEGEYRKRESYLKAEKSKLLKQYNIIETIKHCNLNYNDEIKHITLFSKESFKTYKLLYYLNAFMVYIMKYSGLFCSWLRGHSN